MYPKFSVVLRQTVVSAEVKALDLYREYQVQIKSDYSLL